MKEILGKTALVVLGIMLPILILELAVWLLPTRLLPVSLRQLVQEMEDRARSIDYYLSDSYLGYVMRPGTDFVFKHPDYTITMKTNLNFPHAGFRGGTLGGPAWGVAVGDSFTFGLGVNQEATWIAQLANLVKRDIINFGVPGWGPQQYTRVLEKYGIPLKPRIVFYGLYSNDLGNITRFEKRDGRFNKFSLRKFLRVRSVTFNLFRKLRRIGRDKVPDINLTELGLNSNSQDVMQNLTDETKRLRVAWPIATREIEEALRKSEEISAKFVLLYFPSKEEVYWDLMRKEASTLASYDDRIDYLKRMTLQFCQSRDLLCIDLTPALKSRAMQREKLYFPIDNHWNVEGNRIVAEEIYRFLLAKKIL